jgi:PAS domain S-box-containing protein
MVATVEDITTGVQSEARVLHLQHLLQSITDSMPSAIITLSTDGHVLLWNPAAEFLTGHKATEVEGKKLWEACTEMAHYRDYVEHSLQTNQVMRYHRDQLLANGGTVYRDVSIFPLGDGGIDGVGLCIDDVTRRVQLEEMMLQSAKMASVGGLAAGVAHEINNPLGAMMQSAQVVQMALDVKRDRTRNKIEEFGLDADAMIRYFEDRGLQEYLDGIRVSGERAAKIVTDLLSFSRKTSSKVAPYSINFLIEHTLDLAAADYDLKKRYDFRDIEIVRAFETDLPQVVCDGQQIQQVVLNLVRNAARAMAEGITEGNEPRLVIRTRQQDGWVMFEVEDNGPGIPEADIARLFVPFYSTKTVGEGTGGLGLWLCWSIVVERHKGRIRHEQPENGGSRFVVELPPLRETDL